MKLSVMTLGCPTWDLPTVLTRAKEYGYDGVDIRGLRGTIDITKLPEFTTDLSKSAKLIKDSGLEVSCLSSSINACDPARREANVEEARKFIPIAQAFGAKNIRIFGGGPVKEIGHAKAAEIGRACIEQIMKLDGASGIQWNFETHDEWTQSSDAKRLLDAIPQKNFGACWDIANAARVGGETSAQALEVLGDRIRYLHVKDAKKDPGNPKSGADGWRYVAPGTGDLRIADVVRALIKRGYDGWLLFEHEKHWIPTLEEPEEIFPKFITWVRPLLKK